MQWVNKPQEVGCCCAREALYPRNRPSRWPSCTLNKLRCQQDCVLSESQGLLRVDFIEELPRSLPPDLITIIALGMNIRPQKFGTLGHPLYLLQDRLWKTPRVYRLPQEYPRVVRASDRTEKRQDSFGSIFNCQLAIINTRAPALGCQILTSLQKKPLC